MHFHSLTALPELACLRRGLGEDVESFEAIRQEWETLEGKTIPEAQLKVSFSTKWKVLFKQVFPASPAR